VTEAAATADGSTISRSAPGRRPRRDGAAAHDDPGRARSRLPRRAPHTPTPGRLPGGVKVAEDRHLEPARRFTTWLHVVAVNSARSTYRRMKNRALARPAVPGDAASDPRTQRHRRTRLDLLEDGDALERERWFCCATSGLPYEEIAQLVGRRWAPSNTRSRTAESWCGRCSRTAREAERHARGAARRRPDRRRKGDDTTPRPAHGPAVGRGTPSGSASLPTEPTRHRHPTTSFDPASAGRSGTRSPDVGPERGLAALRPRPGLVTAGSHAAGDATIELRSTADGDHLQLDLDGPSP
jgi:hypothetical protein